MAKLDRRVRLVGWALRKASIAEMDAERLARLQTREFPHNPVSDYVNGGVAKGAVLTDRTAAGQDGSLPVRIYYPSRRATGPLPLVMNFHGGGWTLGTLGQSDWLCSNICVGAGVVVVSVAYRLAPAHRWPAAPEDCYAALVDVLARADDFGIDPTRVGVMGDSAGGNLAAVVSLMARDRSGPTISHQALIYPATDLTLGSESIGENANAPILNRSECLAYRAHYLGEADPHQPYVSPLLADDHTGLPPALVQVAEHDPIRDDGLRYAAALRAAGVPVRCTTYYGMPHGYLAFPKLCKAAPQALGELTEQIGAAL
ncbi:MAG TPA: alpha/beta hydrolase [Pseudonocardiaceae bacterium]|nr:alpha/beta hydrolase [Pseudonocardiaceae bacterium]